MPVYGIDTMIEFEGRTQTLREWAEELGLNAGTLKNRLMRSGWSVERALTTPTMKRGSWDNGWKKRLADKRITFEGEALPISWWSKIKGIKETTIIMRLQRGATIEEALTPGRLKRDVPRRPITCGRCRKQGHNRRFCKTSIYEIALMMSEGFERSEIPSERASANEGV